MKEKEKENEEEEEEGQGSPFLYIQTPDRPPMAAVTGHRAVSSTAHALASPSSTLLPVAPGACKVLLPVAPGACETTDN